MLESTGNKDALSQGSSSLKGLNKSVEGPSFEARLVRERQISSGGCAHESLISKNRRNSPELNYGCLLGTRQCHKTNMKIYCLIKFLRIANSISFAGRP